jgi:hypothetical protein
MFCAFILCQKRGVRDYRLLFFFKLFYCWVAFDSRAGVRRVVDALGQVRKVKSTCNSSPLNELNVVNQWLGVARIV